jgi:hypothetical protein
MFQFFSGSVQQPGRQCKSVDLARAQTCALRLLVAFGLKVAVARAAYAAAINRAAETGRLDLEWRGESWQRSPLATPRITSGNQTGQSFVVVKPEMCQSYLREPLK